MYESNQIEHMQRFPSPHPHIKLFVVSYRSDGLLVKGLLAVPDHEDELPGLLYLRGGIKQVGKVRISRVIQFASRGFVVFAPHYRGNEGGEGFEDFCGEDRNDAFSALQVLESLSCTDSGDLHVFGFSRGGPMALFTAAQFPHMIQSVVVWGGVTDMKLTYEERHSLRKMMKRVVGGSVYKYPERYEWRTPLTEVSKFKAPVLIIHGVYDENVSIKHAYLLEEELKSNDRSYETWYIQDDHHFNPEKKRQVTHDLCDWMKNQKE
ncbi:alpha/beta hydrolase family protein [Pseudalkalibacillus berkeleyi]|uniref:Prolyl oligopeptidase family serine peptidase n=1 Tax=Pseudalkalibacillus berkeleyi TaxID=1069813 RepID=A0ABS9H3H5_9BACL|nr:alpha/beta fold hydrolase [Pseudalkalibacillus berkeleyi]MCF6138365.1 prolyl oligopeptidase family serine peptidase [Pseudalkalibacillus berkeleyi]